MQFTYFLLIRVGSFGGSKTIWNRNHTQGLENGTVEQFSGPPKPSLIGFSAHCSRLPNATA